ncbi:MAG: DEAD/DEAH box helicase [Deltaproteobacteria bacterium]|nr:DEAD/DEAH box helicase [Deltaproteobacteria bacterium]NND28577.1 DEAD/DEAH box helicase family protein [Myxococcales bacterium]MBT8466438.1 DEAD/DEAH box helicase [Deltaproteobacteria bacterium]NNK06553.1 DEAD/DEAH box helicase family protein [Myxococcales bacterium]NNK43646.1 DEAD/DEAH box helicase family protein [Myxococcales bacterium]
MADTAIQETADPEVAPDAVPEEAAPTWREPTTSVGKKLASMSDRAIQRVTGGNAFLRGRLYARRKAVENLEEEEHSVKGEISVRTAEEPYVTRATYSEENDAWESSCTCPGWRGPTGHCKHVAAVMVALRDEVRPPRAKGPQQQQSKKKKKTEPVHVPGTVSVGGKRRRSRRRRRGAAGADAGALEILSPRELQAKRGEARGPMDAWLPAEALDKPLEFEYRMTVRPASITVTPVLAGSRSAVPINDALGAFNMVSIDERPLFRALARNTNRGQATTAELRGEDAAEVLEMLSDRRVLLEPASMELRFANEALKPRIELDPANGDSLRVRVVFYLESNKRRFALSSGAWFEGTPGWQIDTTEGVARPLSELVTPAWLQRLYRSPAMVQSHADLPELLGESIPRVAALLGAELPDLSAVADLVDQKPRFELKANGDIIDARVRLYVRYEDQEFDVPPDEFPSPLAFLPPKKGKGRPRVVRRDVGVEMAGVQALLNQNFEVSESGEELVASGDDAIAFWTNGIGELPEDWDRFIPDDLVDVTIRDESVTPQVRVSSGVDWLNLDMKFESGGAVVREEELRACLEHGRRLVQLEDGTYAPVDPEKVGDVLTRMAEIYATAGMRDKLPLSQAGRVQDLLKMVQNAKVSASAKTLFSKIEDIDEVPSVAKPRTLKADLRPYQKDGFSWLVFLHELNSGGILADDMGLGKTIQTIALLLWAKGKEKRKLNLVVAPTSVVPNWDREIRKFAPSLKTVMWQGPNRSQSAPDLEKADVMITSYALLRRDEELLQALDLRYVILDEAQHIKNPMSQTARSAKKLSSERRLALTGTPIENRLSELWSIFDFVSPGLLGQLKTFEERIARPIDRGDMETAQRLRATIKPFVMRRLKSDVAADLPDKVEQEMIVPLAEEQAKLYKQILGQVRKSILSEVEKKGVSKAQIQILAALTRLRQVACDPRLMKLPDTEFDADDSGKLGALREIVDEAVSGGHRVLVFSQFVQMLNHIRTALDADGVPYEYLDGSTKDRLEKVDRFNEDSSVPVFLISLKAGGTGLNLTGADTVVHFDPWWNPAVEDQATDRAHRIGQTKKVNVYKLIAAGTVEEKILELSAKKRDLVSNVLSTEGSPLKGLTKADVENLFSE